MDKETELRIKKLEEVNEFLLGEIERLKAVNEIQNLMGRYEAIHNTTDMHKSWELWAQHTPDTWVEIANWGLFEGIDQIKKMWEAKNGNPEETRGWLFEHPLATPIIEVAADGKTAKATWVSPGHETKPRDGRLVGHWCWGKYAVDFVKEDGEWKIWHFKWFRGFLTPFDVSWVDRPREPELAQQVPHDFEHKPSTYHKPYFPDSIAESIPPAPKPYNTWTDKDRGWHLQLPEHP